MVLINPRLKVVDEVWIAAALLHREHPRLPDFSVDEVVSWAQRENIYGSLRPGVYVHVIQHCVANRPPNPARYRMLFETRPGRRRIFRNGDPYHPGREGGKITPETNDLPSAYLDLFRWYQDWCQSMAKTEVLQDPLLLLAGSGKQLWADEHADDYVRRLRESCE